MQYNTVTNNGGAGIFLGVGNVAAHKCLKANSQHGFQAYGPKGGESNITLDHNKIVGNIPGNWESRIHGCTAAGSSGTCGTCASPTTTWSVDLVRVVAGGALPAGRGEHLHRLTDR